MADQSTIRACPRDDAVQLCCDLLPDQYPVCTVPGRPVPELARSEDPTCDPTEVVSPDTPPSCCACRFRPLRSPAEASCTPRGASHFRRLAPTAYLVQHRCWTLRPPTGST